MTYKAAFVLRRKKKGCAFVLTYNGFYRKIFMAKNVFVENLFPLFGQCKNYFPVATESQPKTTLNCLAQPNTAANNSKKKIYKNP